VQSGIGLRSAGVSAVRWTRLDIRTNFRGWSSNEVMMLT
jgi:hypothetical protein